MQCAVVRHHEPHQHHQWSAVHGGPNDTLLVRCFSRHWYDSSLHVIHRRLDSITLRPIVQTWG